MYAALHNIYYRHTRTQSDLLSEPGNQKGSRVERQRDSFAMLLLLLLGSQCCAIQLVVSAKMLGQRNSACCSIVALESNELE